MAFLSGCQTTSSSVGRVVISEENSKLVFYDIEAVSMHKEFYKEKTTPHSNIYYLGIWTDPSAIYPHTRIEYIELGPNRHFQHEYSTRLYIEGLNFDGGKPTTKGITGGLKTDLGLVKYQFFNTKNTECVAFARTWRKEYVDMGATSGNVLMVGHHCTRPGLPLTKVRVSEVLHSIGVKGTGVPEPSTAWREAKSRQGTAETMEIPLSFSWPVFGNNLSGKFLRTGKSGGGKIWLSPRKNVDCAGKWKHISGSLGTPNLPQGEWSILCNNGMTAKGTYLFDKTQTVNGEGKDAEDNPVSFSFTEPS